MQRAKKKTVAIIGTNGVPASYGGYETLAENIIGYLSDDFKFSIYCSQTQKIKNNNTKEYKSAELIYIPLKANGWQSIIYDIISLFHASFTKDIILYLGPGAGFAVPFLKLFRKKIIVNHGGLNEWEREKYSSFQRFVAKLGHKYAAKYATFNIADNFLLRDSIKHDFGVNSEVIRYGGDHAIEVNPDHELVNKYPFLETKYYINVSRAQVDNNLHLVLEAFKEIPEMKLVMVSNWSISNYGTKLKEEYKNKYSNIIILDAIYNSIEINAIRSNAIAYIHSHSYCGTSPSLVEAMSLGLPVISFDVPTNRETTKNKALFFKNSKDLTEKLLAANKTDISIVSREMKKIAEKDYTWAYISSQYSALFNK